MLYSPVLWVYQFNRLLCTCKDQIVNAFHEWFGEVTKAAVYNYCLAAHVGLLCHQMPFKCEVGYQISLIC